MYVRLFSQHNPADMLLNGAFNDRSMKFGTLLESAPIKILGYRAITDEKKWWQNGGNTKWPISVSGIMTITTILVLINYSTGGNSFCDVKKKIIYID